MMSAIQRRFRPAGAASSTGRRRAPPSQHRARRPPPANRCVHPTRHQRPWRRWRAARSPVNPPRGRRPQEHTGHRSQRPSSPSSPMCTVPRTARAQRPGRGAVATAMPRSKPEPCLGRLAGERLTVSLRRGMSSPELVQRCAPAARPPRCLVGQSDDGELRRLRQIRLDLHQVPATPVSATAQVRAVLTAGPPDARAGESASARSGRSPGGSHAACGSGALVHAYASRQSRRRLRSSMAWNGCPYRTDRGKLDSTRTEPSRERRCSSAPGTASCGRG